MVDLRRPRLNMRDQKLKMGDFGRPRPNMGDQKSPKLPLNLTVIIRIKIICPISILNYVEHHFLFHIHA